MPRRRRPPQRGQPAIHLATRAQSIGRHVRRRAVEQPAHPRAARRPRLPDVAEELGVEGLDQRKVSLGPYGNHFLLKQRGMFSFLGLSPEQVESLRQEHSIYMVSSSRVNFAGMTTASMDRVCDAVAQVL